ncbi:MAG: glycosyltransferase family 39 protein [Flavobacteriales bacterium]|nr:glycosyltransferase family 39 protein [Flavobacteriales bacterium]
MDHRTSGYHEPTKPSSRRSSSIKHRSRGRSKRKEREQGSALHWFKHDLREAVQRYSKQTSAAHKRFTLLLILAGTALRAWLLNEPVTIDEANMYISFGTQSVGTILTDYSLPINHVLHTVLAKLSTSVFGISTLAMRLPAFLAGVLAMPLFYMLVRSLFNRYIALMALAMVAGCPPLIELSALAQGYSITWCALLAALLVARHLVRENNPWSAAFMGLFLALGMWSVPSMVYGAAMSYLWVLFTLLGKYQRSLSERMTMLGLSVVVLFLATVLFYIPVVMEHGVDGLFHHVSEGDRTWDTFSAGYADRVIDFWMYAADASYDWVLVLGFGGLLHATYISGKFRAIMFALLLGSVPLAIGLREEGGAYTWSHAIFFFCIGSSIALFYLLKLIQEKLVKSMGKRSRTAWAALGLLILFGSGTGVAKDRMGHQAETRPGAALILATLKPDDRLCFDARWERIVSFELLAQGMPLDRLNQVISYKGAMPSGSTLLLALGKRGGPSPTEAIGRCGLPADGFDEPVHFKEWPRLEIFAARKR